MVDVTATATATLIRREQAHRRTVLLALAVLLVLAMSPLVVHHLPIALGGAFAGRDHLWNLCLLALHAIFQPVHGVLHVLFFSGLLYATWDRLSAWRAFRRALTPLGATSPDPRGELGRAAILAGVDLKQVLVVAGLPSPAFTAGWLRPRIYVAACLGRTLSQAELAAVLAHEWAHVERRDPLRLSLLRFLACTLFWLPALRRLAEDIADEGEVRADDRAAALCGLALASALVRLAAWKPHPARPLVVGLLSGDLLERRVLRLTGEDVPPRSRLTRGSLALAFLALLLAWTSGVAVAHPLPEGHHGHCDHHGGVALLHLFCGTRLGGDCVHRPELG